MGMPVKKNGETAMYVVGVYKYDGKCHNHAANDNQYQNIEGSAA